MIDRSKLLYRIILCSPLRDFYIYKVKAPVQKALEWAGTITPEVTKENTEWEGTHALMDIFANLSLYTEIKPQMFEAAQKISLIEVEHDGFYRDFFLLFIEEVIKKILAGKFPYRRDEIPNPYYWRNMTPKGGKLSIIGILQDKKQLENLMGDKWKYKEGLNGDNDTEL